MRFKLLTEHYLEFLSLKGGYTGSSESTLVKMPHCGKSHVVAQLFPCTYRPLGYSVSGINAYKTNKSDIKSLVKRCDINIGIMH